MVFSEEEIYKLPPEKRKISWFIYYELVHTCANSILILGLITAWELVFRDIFFK